MVEPPALTRRRFFQALAASALAAGVPLAVGMPEETWIGSDLGDRDQWTVVVNWKFVTVIDRTVVISVPVVE